ncbi:MAG: hypothetical protein HGA31_00300 [Candidatus Moranbacteria bacterium]|nr:hypothetical protein [Candidatus Moranbacteria bacterium]
MLERELMEIGLNEKEVKVYLASLELGQSAVQGISNKAGVNRATTYFVIEGLMEKGLMSSFHKGKKQFFVAADPERLLDILDGQEREIRRKSEDLKKLLPQLQSMNNKDAGRPVVRYYEGREGILTMIEEFTMSACDVVNMAYCVDSIEKVFPKEVREKSRAKRIAKGIMTKVIYTYTNGVLESTADGQRRKVPFDRFPIKSDIAVYGDKVRIASLGDRLTGVVIEDKDIADSFKAILDLAWEAAERYQSEE